MEACLSEINRSEALRYLGCRGDADEAAVRLVRQAEQRILPVIEPRFLYRVFSIEEKAGGVHLRGCAFVLGGKDIAAHLAGCPRCVLLAATLGVGVERVIRSAQVYDMALALALDACATAAIEQVCDIAQAQIEKEMRPQPITTRYSPGYGDLPISCQAEFVALLDCQRRIGLTATKSNILTPRKSVTAIIGVGAAGTKREGGCKACNFYESCSYRKAGTTCGS